MTSNQHLSSFWWLVADKPHQIITNRHYDNWWQETLLYKGAKWWWRWRPSLLNVDDGNPLHHQIVIFIKIISDAAHWGVIAKSGWRYWTIPIFGMVNMCPVAKRSGFLILCQNRTENLSKTSGFEWSAYHIIYDTVVLWSTSSYIRSEGWWFKSQQTYANTS